MKRIKRIAIVILIIICAFIYSHITKMNEIYDRSVDSSEYLSTGVVDSATIEQSFPCVEETIDGVYVKCQIMGDVSGVEIKYALRESGSNNIVAEGSKPASEIESTKFNEFRFNTVEGCKDKIYTLEIWIENSTDENGISFYFQDSIESQTEFVVAGNTTQGTLIMRTMTDRFDFETFCIVLVFVVFIYVFMRILYKLFK